MLRLHLRNELWKLFGKQRTYIGIGVFLVAQNLMLVLLHFSHWQRTTARLLEGNGYIPDQYFSCLTVALIMLIPQIALLMPLYVTLTGGDMVAKEAEDGTMRMILCRPVSRFRLCAVKWLAGALFSALLVVSLGLMALGFARMWFPWGDMFVFVPVEVRIFNAMAAGEGLSRFAMAHLILAVNACTMFSLAFMFSCCNVKPAAATVLAMSLLFVCFVMENMPFFEEYKDWMITHHFRAWIMVFAKPLPLPDMLASLSVLLGVNVTAFIIGVTAFQIRDIKS